MGKQRVLIKNGMVYDGTGAVAIKADILLEHGFIKEVGKLDLGGFQGEIIDASGKTITPGFIDSHRHGDFAVFTETNFGEAELSQGITTVINGNCGMSAAPFHPEYSKGWYAFMEPCLGIAPSGFDFSTVDAYLSALEAHGTPVEMGCFVGMGSLKAAIKGFSSSRWTKSELETAGRFLKEGLESGAWGISCGIMYAPECFTSTDEYVKLLKPAAAYGCPLFCHLRSEGDHLVEAVDEAIEIGKRAGLAVNISHFKVFGKRNWGRLLPVAIERIEAARNQGQDITVDFYPYTGGSTTLLTLVPPCCTRETIEETLDVLSRKEGVEQLREEIMKDQPGWDNMVKSIGWERVLISSVCTEKNMKCQGLSIPEICELYGDEDETACMVRILCEEQGKAGIIVMSMDPSDVDMIARLPYSSVISDSLYGAPDFPHPRLYGSFPKILRDFVRERKILTPEQAIYKMTGQTAERLGMRDRGVLKPGMRADINVFDWNCLEDKATFTNPKALTKGMELVMIGGEIVWKQECFTGNHRANVIRKN